MTRHTGVSVRRVEDITQALLGTRVSSGLVSKLDQKVYGQIEALPNRKLDGRYPYVYLDSVLLFLRRLMPTRCCFVEHTRAVRNIQLQEGHYELRAEHQNRQTRSDQATGSRIGLRIRFL
jgi:hypothetical protein